MINEHWSDEYVGQLYDDEVFNCGHMVEMVLSEHYDIKIELPCDIAGLRCQSTTIIENVENFAEPAEDGPKDGYGILLSNRRLFHIGICVDIDSKFYCLHNVKSFGAVMRHKLSDLSAFELIIEGYYKWRQVPQH